MSVFAGGFIGNVAAQDQENEQNAKANVNQGQWVEQTNVNVQDDNTAIAVGSSKKKDSSVTVLGPPDFFD